MIDIGLRSIHVAYPEYNRVVSRANFLQPERSVQYFTYLNACLVAWLYSTDRISTFVPPFYPEYILYCICMIS